MYFVYTNSEYLLFLSIIVEIVRSALVQESTRCMPPNNRGYQCEGYGCGKVGNCTLGGRPGIHGDTVFTCEVGRPPYWENFKNTIPQTEECAAGRCEPAILTNIWQGPFDLEPRIGINFTVPPASVKNRYYPGALLLNISSSVLKFKRNADEYYDGGEWESRVYNFTTYFGTSTDRVLKRFLLFECFLLQLKREDNNAYKVYNLEFKVFSWSRRLQQIDANNLTRTLVYNVTVIPANFQLNAVNAIAVARYPSPDDLHVVFSNVSQGVSSYIVRVVDINTKHQWGNAKNIPHMSSNYSCDFRGISHGTVRVEIIAVTDKGLKVEPVFSHPILFGAPETLSPESVVVSSKSTVAYAAVSGLVISVLLLAALCYWRRKTPKKNLKTEDTARVLLLYSTKRKENITIAKRFLDLLRTKFDGTTVIYEGDFNEKTNIIANIHHWFDDRINWATHVIVLWLPGSVDNTEEKVLHGSLHFPTALDRVINQHKEEDKRLLCVYFNCLTDKKNIPDSLKQNAKVVALPAEFEDLYQNILGCKCPNNVSLVKMSKLKREFPDLVRALEKARRAHADVDGDSESTCEFLRSNSSGSEKSFQVGISYSDDSIISEIDPKCPIHGNVLFHRQSPEKEKSQNQELSDKEQHSNLHQKNIIRSYSDPVQAESPTLSKRVLVEIHAPSDEDSISATSLDLEYQMLQMNNMEGNWNPEEMPLLNKDTSVQKPKDTAIGSKRRHPYSDHPQCDHFGDIDYHQTYTRTYQQHQTHEMQPLLNDLSEHHRRLQHQGCHEKETRYVAPANHYTSRHMNPQFSQQSSVELYGTNHLPENNHDFGSQRPSNLQSCGRVQGPKFIGHDMVCVGEQHIGNSECIRSMENGSRFPTRQTSGYVTCSEQASFHLDSDDDLSSNDFNRRYIDDEEWARMDLSEKLKHFNFNW